MLLDLLFWLPTKLARCLLQPVAAMGDSIADATEALIKEYEEEHGL
jgi:hypothetical protein